MTGLGRALLILIAVSAAACATTGGAPRPFPGAPLPPPSTPPPPAGAPVVVPPVAAAPGAIVTTALMLKGTPYRNGGSDPSRGFDCSGFVQWVFAQNGVHLPREAHDQYEAGRKIDLREVKPGDLLFFATESRGASHVGVAIGGDQFVHAPSSRGVVRVETFTATYWAKRYVGARRVE